MAVTKKFGVEGLEELRKALLQISEEVVPEAITESAVDALEPTKRWASSKVPVATGNLRDSIKIRRKKRLYKSGRRFKKNTAIAGAEIVAGGRGKKGIDGRMPGEYVLGVHYGNDRNPQGEEFLGQTFENDAPRILNRFASSLKNRMAGPVNKIGAKTRRTRRR